MKLMPLAGVVLAVTALLTSSVDRAGAATQPIFYTEIPHEGRVYVFASAERLEGFEQSGRTEMGPSITRPGYGPKGETVVFDSEAAITLYNFKHDLPGESFPAKPEEKPKSPYPSGKLSGLVFGDYYRYDEWHQDAISPTNPDSVEGQEGFWLRRIYLTYDLDFSAKLTTRLRIEANSDGQFAGGNLEPYVKDAFLKWAYQGQHQATLGIQPSLTFDWLERFWGLRHVEKTPADLYRIDSSRDLGLSFHGPLVIDGLSYAAQFGNESGTGSETDEYKILRFECRFERKSGVAFELLYSDADRPADEDRRTAQAFAGYRTEVVRGGVQYLRQERDNVPDLEIDIGSAFVVWSFMPAKASLFARADTVRGDLGGTETGLPGADSIDYLILSPDAPFTTWIVGGEYHVNPSIHVGPNAEIVKYEDDPDPVGFPGRDEDRIYRVTFFWTF
jgi:hypothetical protein